MLAVMLILLLATATAAVSVQSTGYELRAAGHNRKAMQTRLISEGGLTASLRLVDNQSASSLVNALNTLESTYLKVDDTIMPTGSRFNEPSCVPPHETCDRYVHERSDSGTDTDSSFPDDAKPFPFNDAGNPGQNIFGPKQSYQPWFVVDVKYEEDDARPLPGFRVDEGATVKFVNVTYISRGGTELASGSVGTTRTTRTTCASVRLGPVAAF